MRQRPDPMIGDLVYETLSLACAESAGLFCRLQVAGCRLKFHYNWKTADTKKKHTSVRLTVTDT